MPRTDDASFEIPGLGTIRYGWSEVAQLIKQFGSDFDSTLTQAAEGFDIESIAAAIAIGLDNDMTAEDVMNASPPIVETIGAMLGALNVAFHGKADGPDEPDENPSKPNRQQRRATSSKTRGGKHSASD